MRKGKAKPRKKQTRTESKPRGEKSVEVGCRRSAQRQHKRMGDGGDGGVGEKKIVAMVVMVVRMMTCWW